MVDLSGSPALEQRITGHLAEHFPPNDRRTPDLVPGPVEIDFETRVVPTLGQRSRDPAEAADGAIWWAGQRGNLIGRIDPETGEIERIREMPDPLVRFDPGTETFRSWPIASSGLYSGILRHVRTDPKGRLLIHQSATDHILRVSVSQGSNAGCGSDFSREQVAHRSVENRKAASLIRGRIWPNHSALAHASGC